VWFEVEVLTAKLPSGPIAIRIGRRAMTALLVTYDLVGADATTANYDDLITAIKSYDDWCRVQDSVWIISTDDHAVTVRDALTEHTRKGDRILVACLTGVAAWQNARCKTEALKRVLNS
jgi:hypothetical protein